MRPGASHSRKASPRLSSVHAAHQRHELIGWHEAGHAPALSAIAPVQHHEWPLPAQSCARMAPKPRTATACSSSSASCIAAAVTAWCSTPTRSARRVRVLARASSRYFSGRRCPWVGAEELSGNPGSARTFPRKPSRSREPRRPDSESA